MFMVMLVKKNLKYNFIYKVIRFLLVEIGLLMMNIYYCLIDVN